MGIQIILKFGCKWSVLSQKAQDLKPNSYILIDVYPTSFSECLYIWEAVQYHDQ